jgi:hypothetical protein
MKTLQALCLIATVAVCGCAGMREREKISQNFLMTHQNQNNFLEVWGNPTKSYSETADGLRTEWSQDADSGWVSLRGNRVYDVWDYENKGVTLVFYHQSLFAWKWHTEPNKGNK